MSGQLRIINGTEDVAITMFQICVQSRARCCLLREITNSRISDRKLQRAYYSSWFLRGGKKRGRDEGD